MRSLFLLLLTVLLTGGFVYAAPGNDTLPGANNALQSRFDPEAATQKYLALLPAAAKAKSDAYFEGKYWLLLWNILYDAIVAWILLFGGLSKWIRKKASRFRSVNMRNWIYALMYLGLVFLFTFPLALYQDFFREHQYDLLNQTFLEWLGDGLKSIALVLAFGSVAIVILYAAIRKAGRNWWIWGSGLAICLQALIILSFPPLISPLFNKYEPLPNGPIRDEILSMTRANLVPADNVYEFNASRQSDRISANVSGIAGTTRVSLNDNLLKRCSPAEIKAVMGHELGHYVLNHNYKGLMELGILIFVGFAFVNKSFGYFSRRYAGQWNVENIADIGGLPLFLFLFSLYLFVATPLTNSITRVSEIEADQFGLNAAREPDGFAAVAMKLSEYRKIDPGYWEEIFFFDHPSGRRRVHTSMVWKAEQLNR